MMRNLVRCPVPVIAAIEGPCLGGGYELALACDWIVAGDRARVGLPEIKRGIFPGTAGIPCLERRVGLHAARMLILTGATIEAKDALGRGLVDDVVPQGNALPTAIALADTLATSPAQAVRAIKQMSDHDFLERFDRHLMAEIDAFEEIFQTADAHEGCAAFFDKRSPQWILPNNGLKK
jgi:enoyl-CoA hydratase/carnithine racemase